MVVGYATGRNTRCVTSRLLSWKNETPLPCTAPGHGMVVKRADRIRGGVARVGSVNTITVRLARLRCNNAVNSPKRPPMMATLMLSSKEVMTQALRSGSRRCSELYPDRFRPGHWGQTAQWKTMYLRLWRKTLGVIIHVILLGSHLLDFAERLV